MRGEAPRPQRTCKTLPLLRPEGCRRLRRRSGTRVRRRPSGVKRFLCDNRRVVPPLCRVRACTLAAVTVILLASPVVAGWAAPALPPGVPPSTRERLAPVTDQASLASHVDGVPFQARRDVFEYLLDHPDFATHVTRTVRAARYKIWAVPGGFGLDDGWGTVGTFELVYTAPGVRIMHLKGEYQQRILPDIRGEVIVMINY